MKKLKRALSIALIAVFTFALVGCGAKKENLIDAMEKSSDMNAFNVNANIKMDISGKSLQDSPLGAQSQNVEIGVTGKVVKEKNKSFKTDMNMKVGVMGISFDMDMLADASINEGNPDFKAYVQIPEILKMQAGPIFGDAEYLYVGSDTLEELKKLAAQSGQPMPEINMAEIMDKAVKMNDASYKFLRQYSEANEEFIKDLGKQEVEVNGEKQSLQSYEIKMDNEGLKKFLKAYMGNEDNKKALEEYMTIFSDIEGANAEKIDLAQALKDVDSMPNIFGDEGLTMTFAVKDGYIVQEKMKTHLSAEGDEINYDLTVDFTDINGDVKVDIPNKEDIKSMDLMQLVQTMMTFGM